MYTLDDINKARFNAFIGLNDLELFNKIAKIVANYYAISVDEIIFSSELSEPRKVVLLLMRKISTKISLKTQSELFHNENNEPYSEWQIVRAYSDIQRKIDKDTGFASDFQEMKRAVLK